MGKILDSAAVGIYNAINFLSLIINVISKSFIDAYQPWVYKKLEEGEKGKIDMIKAAKFISVAFVFFGFILSILSKEIIEIVINKQYHSGIKIAPIVVYSSVLLFMGSLFAFVLYFYKNTTKYIAFSTIAGAITNIALSLLLIPKYGILGGSVALAIANIVISIIKQIYASKAMNLNALLFDVYILATINLFVSLYLLQNNYSIFIRLLVLIAEFLIISIIYKNLIKYSLNKLDIHLPSYNRYFQES